MKAQGEPLLSFGDGPERTGPSQTPAICSATALVSRMVYGIGTDICDVRRIRASYERFGERFAQRILCDGELATWRARSLRWPERGVRYLATRFSAKEAFSKAIGMGMVMPMTWRACEITRLPSGQPAVQLHGSLREWFEAKGLKAHVSLTDESDYAASFVVVEHIQPYPSRSPS